jgi:hypothetical protein
LGIEEPEYSFGTNLATPIASSLSGGTENAARQGFVEDVVRVRTGERGHKALMYPDDIDMRKAMK